LCCMYGNCVLINVLLGINSCDIRLAFTGGVPPRLGLDCFPASRNGVNSCWSSPVFTITESV
jgi:hypothetical protein